MSSEVSRLDEVAEVVDSLHKTPSYVEHGHPMVRVTDVKYGELDLSKTLRVDDATFREFSRRYTPSAGDIIITRVGTYGVFGRVVNPSFCLGQNTAAIIPKSISAGYLYAVLNSEFVRSQIEAGVVGSTQKTLSLKAIKALQIPRMGSTYEAEVASFSSTLDDRITLLREANATLEAIAKALFKSWFVDFDSVRAKMEGRAPEGMDEATAALFPDSFEETELGVVPRGWRWGTLGDLATFQNGYAFKSKDWTGVGHPVVKIGDVKPGIIDLEGCSYVAPDTVAGLDRFRLSRGDLLVGMTGYVGETGLVPSVEPAAFLNQRVGRMATKSGLADIGYVYCAARSSAFKEFAEAQSHGSAQANVSGASLMAFPAAVAPAPLIECFNNAIAGVIEGILANHEKAQTLSTFRDTLLPRLISGQLF